MIGMMTHATDSTLVSLRRQDFHELQDSLCHTGKPYLNKQNRLKNIRQRLEYGVKISEGAVLSNICSL